MRKKFGVLLAVSLMIVLIVYVPRATTSQSTSWGPRMEHVRYPTYLSPWAQTLSMQRRDTEFLTDLEDPVNIETLAAAGRKMFSNPQSHFCYITFNLKNWWLGPVDGRGGPGKALRHAMAHLVPKDELIGTLYKYTVTKIEAPGPPAQGEWYNSNVDPHSYDPDMAHDILTSGGWTWDAGDSRWELAVAFAGYPAGTPMPATYLYSPEFETAPTSWEIVRTSVARMTGAGPFTAHPLPVVHDPIDLNELLDILDFEPNRSSSHDEGGWDSYFMCFDNLGNTARFLYGLFHSRNDYGGWEVNAAHLHNDTLDWVLEILIASLDHAEKVAAAHTAYELLMGSPANQYNPWTDGIIVYIPIYSRTSYNAIDEGLKGVVQMLLTGLDQGYTFNNMYWADPTGHESDLVPGGNMVLFCNQEPLQTPLNPAYASSPYTWFVMDYLYDGLLATNPYTLEPYAWMLNETKDPDFPNTPGYYIEPWGDGMKVTYYLVDDTILWQDGHPVDAFDCEFAWEFQKEYQIGQWWETFTYFDHADVIDVPYNRTIATYWATPYYFFPITAAGMALCFPEHIWGCTHERGGRATPSCVYVPEYAEMYDGTPITVESGLCGCAPGTAHTAPEKTTCVHGCGCVIDHPATAPNEVYAYDPSYYAHATAEFPWLTELTGSGPYIFRSYNPTAMVTDIIAFDAARTGSGGDPNVHYWKSTDELHQHLVDMFWEVGDCDCSGKIDVDDLIIMDNSTGLWWWMPGFDPDADVNSDGVVDVRDIARLSRNFGTIRES